MSQIHRKLASFFVVFAAVIVYQFSLVLTIAVLVIAVFLFQGFQMSDLRINVQSSSRVQSFVSSLYSWSESAVSSVVRKCKNLTVSESESSSRLPIQSSSTRKIGNQNTICSSSESVSVSDRENIYKGSSFHQSPRVVDKFPKATVSSSPVSVTDWNRKGSSASGGSLNKSVNSTSRFYYVNDSLSQRSSPWGCSLSPQQRNNVADVRPVQAVAAPLTASSRHNTSRESALFVDVNSPGFSSRLLKYHSEAAIHQPQYTRPGQLPLVHLNNSPLPTLSARNSQKVGAPVRVRIAPPTYDATESRLFARPDKQPVQERQSKSVIDVLKEISRKRMHTEDGGNEAKRHHHQSDSSSSSSSSSTHAMVNGVMLEPAPTGKRPREEDSPKLPKPTVKRTRNNEIYSSLSSSRNINIGTKRKAAESWSRCSTPVPIGKHLKKSPHLTGEDEDAQILKLTPHQEKEPSPLPKIAPERKVQVGGHGNSTSPNVNTVRSAELRPSFHNLPEKLDEESFPSKSQPARSHHGRLFVKAFSRGVANEGEGMKDAHRSGGTKPWKTQQTIDVDAITGEDIVGQDLELGSKRLNSMFSVLQSNASTVTETSKADVVDGATSKPDASKPVATVMEPNGGAPTVNPVENSFSNPSINIGEQSFPSSTTATCKTASVQPNKIVTTNSEGQGTASAFGTSQNPLSNSATPPVVNEKEDYSVPSTKSPILAPSSSIPPPLPPTTAAPFSSIVPTSDSVSASSQPTSPSSQTTLAESKKISPVPSSAPSGIFGSSSAATFTMPQLAEKSVTTTSTFSFGASTSTSGSTPLISSSGFVLPVSSSAVTPAVSTPPQPAVASSFTMLPQNPSTTVSNTIDYAKPDVPISTTGGFSFSVSSSAPPSSSALSVFSLPKTTSSAISFGISQAPTTTVASTTAVTSIPSISALVSTNADSSVPKPFAFGTTASTTTLPTTTTSSSGGFSFQFSSNTQPNLAPPKPQETPAGFKFSFGANKEEGGLSLNQPAGNPITKPPAFGEGFSFGASSNTSVEENKPLTFGTPTSLTSTIAAPSATPATGGFNFTADAVASASLPKPTFGFGTNSNASGATSSGLGSSGTFTFGAKPAETPSVAPAPTVPSLGSPFQFGANSPTMSTASTLQAQSQTVNSPFSIGTSMEQKAPVLGGGFSFGAAPSASIPSIQQSTPAFGQSSAPNFGSPAINPLQSQPVAPAPAPAIFQFGSAGSTMPQPGMSSGGFNFGGAPAPAAPPSGFNFNPTGPSATTPFQFGANPLQPGMQAPAMFSIGSGSTAPRSRPRNRRTK